MQCRCSTGFTLLEVMIAISIFALMGLGGYVLLDATIRTKEAVDNESAQLSDLQKTIDTLQQDLGQMIAIRQESGDGFVTGQGGIPMLEFIAHAQVVAANLDDTLALAYYLENNLQAGTFDLVRYALSLSEESAVERMVLYTGLTAGALRLKGADQQWRDKWPGAGAADGFNYLLPALIELTLEHPDTGVLVKYFESPAGMSYMPTQAGDG